MGRVRNHTRPFATRWRLRRCTVRGQVLTVDVAPGGRRSRRWRRTSRGVSRGNGFAVKLCYDRIPVGIDPFDPRNLVVFCTGPVTDSSIPGNSGAAWGEVAPERSVLRSTYGGRFRCPAPYRFRCHHPCRRRGEPVYVVVDEQGATLKSAKDLWGMRTLEAARAILGLEVRTATS